MSNESEKVYTIFKISQTEKNARVRVFHRSSNTCVFSFSLEDYAHSEILQAQEQSSIVPREQILSLKEPHSNRDTTYVDHNIQQGQH